MKRMVALLLFCLPGSALGYEEEITLQPGNCILVPRVYRICAAPAPQATPSPISKCFCEYGIRSTTDGKPGKGFWLMQGDDPIRNFLSDEDSCYKATKNYGVCSQ